MRPRTRVPCILTFALLLILLAGCGRQASFTASVSPDRGPAATLDARTGAQAAPDQLQGSSGFFPLTVGNRWHYTQSLSLVTVTPGQPTPPPTLFTTGKTSRLVGAEFLGGREYVVEEDVVIHQGAPYPTQRIYWRQDRSGLYEADVPVSGLSAGGARATALARARTGLAARGAAFATALDALDRKLALVERVAGGLRARPADGTADPDVPAELTRLLYPLHPGVSWTIRTDPLFAASVEGSDVLATPAGRFNGWRMRYTSELFGPNDVVHVWYGRDGYLGLQAHLEVVATDESGNPIGTEIAEQGERLDGIALVKGGSPGF